MIRSLAHILVRTQVLSQCMTRDTLPTDILPTDMEEVMEDTLAMPWAGTSVNMTHTSIMATKDTTEEIKRIRITSTRLLILQDLSLLDTARQQPQDMHREHPLLLIEVSKTSLLPGSKYPTSADHAHTTRPHLPDPHQPWEAVSHPTTSSNNNNTNHHTHKPAAHHQPQTDTLHTTTNNPTITTRKQPKAHHHHNSRNRAIKLPKASIERSRHESRRRLRLISLIRVLRSWTSRIISHPVERIDRLVC